MLEKLVRIFRMYVDADKNDSLFYSMFDMMHLNLRQKMIAGFIFYLIFYTWISILFFKDFEIFNRDVKLLIHAANLNNISLEIRRYEKNFFLSGEISDYNTAQKYTDEAIDYLPMIKSDLEAVSHLEQLKDIENQLKTYKHTLASCWKECEGNRNENFLCSSSEKIRFIGHSIVQITENLVHSQQRKMEKFIHYFILKLIFYMSIMALFTIIATILLYRKIVSPLKYLEKAANTIAKGTFNPLPVTNSKDEVQSVFMAFNRMVVELEQHQEQLLQAKKLSSIGTMASGIAHQLNNPLNNISTSCQIALSELNDGDCHFIEKLLKTIDMETHRAAEIVKGLLEFSRAQSFSIQPACLDEVVSKVFRLVSSDVPAGITLKKDIPKDIVVNIDAQKMIEALLNLVINAVQAIPERSGTVTVKAEINDEKDAVVITVIDTGTGIDEKDIHKIFDPFYSTKTVGKGTGLGLAVVYGIIKKHKGSIRVESIQGKGSQFIITLPLGVERTGQTKIT